MSCQSEEWAAAVEAIAEGLKAAMEDNGGEVTRYGQCRNLEAEARALAARMRDHVATPPAGPGDGFVPTMHPPRPLSPETTAIIDRLYPATARTSKRDFAAILAQGEATNAQRQSIG